jgi:hypothetical protein
MRDSKHPRPEADALESRALLSGARALHPSPELGRAHQATLIEPRTSAMREEPVAMVKCIPTASGGVFCVPGGLATPPRTGGAAALVSPGVLLVVTNKPGNFPNEATIQDDGGGNVTVEWNGHKPPTFHAISQIVVDARGKMNTVTFNLTGNVTNAQEFDVQLDGTNSSFVPNLGAFNASGLVKIHLDTAPAPKNLAKGP